MKREICNNELYEYEFRTYYYCQRVKGHRGLHSLHSHKTWSDND